MQFYVIVLLCEYMLIRELHVYSKGINYMVYRLVVGVICYTFDDNTLIAAPIV